MYLPTRDSGRLAKMMSFLVKHSSTADDDEMTTMRRRPKRSEKMGPYFRDRLWRVRCMGGFTRWRWPITGSAGGLGGRFLW